MLGVIVNTFTVIVGSIIGLLFKKGIPERVTSAIMKGIGLCTLYIGISGSLKGENTLILIISMLILICIGAMTIVGSLNAGLTGDNEMLFTKSTLDFFSACMLSVSLGIGVLFSSAFVFVFQGAIVLAAVFISPILTDAAIAEMICVGSVMIIGLGTNLLDITKLKIANMLPAIAVAPILCYII